MQSRSTFLFLILPLAVYICSCKQGKNTLACLNTESISVKRQLQVASLKSNYNYKSPCKTSTNHPITATSNSYTNVFVDFVRIKLDLKNLTTGRFFIESVSLHVIEKYPLSEYRDTTTGFVETNNYGSVQEFKINSEKQNYIKVSKNLILEDKEVLSDHYHLFKISIDNQSFRAKEVVEFHLSFQLSSMDYPSVSYQVLSDQTYMITHL